MHDVYSVLQLPHTTERNFDNLKITTKRTLFSFIISSIWMCCALCGHMSNWIFSAYAIFMHVLGLVECWYFVYAKVTMKYTHTHTAHTIHTYNVIYRYRSVWLNLLWHRTLLELHKFSSMSEIENFHFYLMNARKTDVYYFMYRYEFCFLFLFFYFIFLFFKWQVGNISSNGTK